ncbi:MAG: hypothetical protein OQK51_12470 [Kangiellaceae bacterium]|nr:hypothetical protein [Kangiellaceae bacterium]
MRQKLSSPSASVDSMKPDYRRDPIFCWLMVSAAYEKTKHKTSQPFAADHAMSAIGLGGVEETLQPFSKLKQPELSPEVIYFLSTSILAAELAKQIGAAALGRPQTYWTALFYQMPNTLLWYMQPKAMWRIYYRQLSLPKKMALFEESKLGFNLHDWRIAVADHFHMSEDLQLLFNKVLPDNLKELHEYARNGFSEKTPSLKEWHRQEAWLVILCNRLARAITVPWQARSYKNNFDLIQQLLSMESNRLSSIIQQSIRDVSKSLSGSQLMVPAMGYLMLNSKPYFPEWLNNRELVRKNIAQKKQHSSTAVTKRKSQLTELIKRLTTTPHSFNNSAELVNAGLKGLIDELDFSRVAFLAVDHKTKFAQTKIALCKKGAKKIRPEFEFKNSTPLSKFIEQQTFMCITKEKHQKVWRKLPLAIQKDNVQAFVFCSLQPGKQVRALIYIDSDNLADYSLENLAKVKMLIKALNSGLAARNAARRLKKQA